MAERVSAATCSVTVAGMAAGVGTSAVSTAAATSAGSPAAPATAAGAARAGNAATLADRITLEHGAATATGCIIVELAKGMASVRTSDASTAAAVSAWWFPAASATAAGAARAVNAAGCSIV